MEDIFLPVFESSIVLAAQYAKAAGRDFVTPQDSHMGMMYAVRYVTGKQVGSLFPEVYDEEEEEEEEEEQEDEEMEEDVFTRYEGDDNEYALKMNECADTWDDWEPETPAEYALKEAVNKVKNNYV